MARLDGVAGDIRKHLPRLHCPLELAGGESFPLGEGRSAKSMYHPAKIWSTRAFGRGVSQEDLLCCRLLWNLSWYVIEGG